MAWESRERSGKVWPGKAGRAGLGAVRQGLAEHVKAGMAGRGPVVQDREVLGKAGNARSGAVVQGKASLGDLQGKAGMANGVGRKCPSSKN